MVHDYIAHRLNEWAKWRLHRQDGGHGYPKQVAWVDNLPKSGYVHFSPDVRDECFEVEKCVIALRAENRLLFDVVMATYCELGTVEAKAKRLGCCTKTFYNHIGSAHRLVLGYLNDLSCDIALPVINLNNFRKSA